MERPQVVGRGAAGEVVAGELLANFVGFEPPGIWVDEDLVDAISHSHRDAR